MPFPIPTRFGCAKETVRQGSRARPRLQAVLMLLLLTAPCSILAGQEGREAAPPGDPAGPQFALHGFTDITFRSEWYGDSPNSPSSSSAFALGQFDLYMVSRLSEGISFLGESVFEFVNGAWIVDVERVLLQYSWSDYLKLRIGRGHTALGYWNEAYHHGALLYPTVERPEALKFEDDGGILPVHYVGIELSGTAPFASGWALDYVANVANGRGLIQDEIQSADDIDQNKAVAVKLSLVGAWGGDRTIRIGPSVYRDRIPADPATPGREGSIDGTVLGAHLVYEGRRVHLLAEAYAMRNDYRLTRERFDHSAWYTVLVARLGKVNPYVGIDGIEFDRGDLFFPSDFDDLTRYLAGVRFDVLPYNAVKVEYRRDERPNGTTDAVAIQSAFTF
ncbi:MAG: hypothetical protein ABR543_12675 [Gemmatimonadaceae bacterium]